MGGDGAPKGMKVYVGPGFQPAAGLPPGVPGMRCLPGFSTERSPAHLCASLLRQIVLALAAAVALPACHRITVQASTFNVADPTRSNQLIYGFYGVEAKPSRWTARKFSFALKPPDGAGTKGGKLWIRLFVPDRQIRNIGPMTLEASIDGYSLATQEFTQGGMYVYAAKVPAELLDTNLVPVHCEFDRAAPPSAADNRELGAVLTEVGLQAN